MDVSREIGGSRLSFVTGDILESTAQCIVNPVNTVGVMGSGLALKFKKRYPSMFDAYKIQCKNGSLNTGRLMFYKMSDADRIICLFPTKQHWQNPSTLEYIDRGLDAFIQHYAEWDITSVAFPKLGCGLGGLNWDYHVGPLLTRKLSDLPIDVQIYI